MLQKKFFTIVGTEEQAAKGCVYFIFTLFMFVLSLPFFYYREHSIGIQILAGSFVFFIWAVSFIVPMVEKNQYDD